MIQEKRKAFCMIGQNKTEDDLHPMTTGEFYSTIASVSMYEWQMVNFQR